MHFDMGKQYKEHQKASSDAKAKALKKKSSTEYINEERKRQGYKPKKFDRATKGLYDFLDK